MCFGTVGSVIEGGGRGLVIVGGMEVGRDVAGRAGSMVTAGSWSVEAAEGRHVRGTSSGGRLAV